MPKVVFRVSSEKAQPCSLFYPAWYNGATKISNKWFLSSEFGLNIAILKGDKQKQPSPSSYVVSCGTTGMLIMGILIQHHGEWVGWVGQTSPSTQLKAPPWSTRITWHISTESIRKSEQFILTIDGRRVLPTGSVLAFCKSEYQALQEVSDTQSPAAPPGWGGVGCSTSIGLHRRPFRTLIHIFFAVVTDHSSLHLWALAKNSY